MGFYVYDETRRDQALRTKEKVVHCGSRHSSDALHIRPVFVLLDRREDGAVSTFCHAHIDNFVLTPDCQPLGKSWTGHGLVMA